MKTFFFQTLVASGYRPLQVFNNFRRRLGLLPRGSLRVLIYHDIPPSHQNWFTDQIRWLSKRWRFVTPAQFEAMIDGNEAIHGRNLLLTFDDGFKSHRGIADDVLNPMRLKALFFIPTDFVGLVVNHAETSLVARRFYPIRKIAGIPKTLAFMDWSDLSHLVEAGHAIGAHTRTHAVLSITKQTKKIESELLGSGVDIEQQLNIEVRHFAFPFGDMNRLPSDTLAIAQARYTFIHTGVRGDNLPRKHRCAIRRDNMPTGCSNHFGGALLEGAADFKYRPRYKEISINAGKTAGCALENPGF